MRVAKHSAIVRMFSAIAPLRAPRVLHHHSAALQYFKARSIPRPRLKPAQPRRPVIASVLFEKITSAVAAPSCRPAPSTKENRTSGNRAYPPPIFLLDRLRPISTRNSVALTRQLLCALDDPCGYRPEAPNILS